MKEKSCSLCKSKNHSYFKTFYLHMIGKEPIPQRLVKCQKCGLIFVNSSLSEEQIGKLYEDDLFYHDQQKDRIETDKEPEVKEWEEPRYVKELNKIANYIDTGKLLDIGCGYGAMLRVAQQMGWQTYGIELSRACGNICRNKWGLSVFHGSIFEANFPSDFFEIVIMDNVLEHIPNPEVFLQETRRILKPGGILLVNVPNISGFSFKCWFLYLKVKKIPGEPRTYGHLFFYNKSTIIAMLENNGFKVKEIYTEQAPHLGGSVGLERVLKKMIITLCKMIPNWGNQLAVYSIKSESNIHSYNY